MFRAGRERRRGAGGLTQRINVVTVRPSQSQMLKVRKQHTEMKKRSEETDRQTVKHSRGSDSAHITADRAAVQPSLPHLPGKMVFTSAVTAGKTDRVTVNTNVTQKAMTQIWKRRKFSGEFSQQKAAVGDEGAEMQARHLFEDLQDRGFGPPHLVLLQ